MAKAEMQEVIIINARGVATHQKLEVGNLCMASDDTSEAWELDYNQQSKDVKTGKLVQFISTLNKKPLRIFKNRPQIPGLSILNIAKQEFKASIMEIEEENHRKSMLLWLGIIIMSIIVTIALIILLNM